MHQPPKATPSLKNSAPRCYLGFFNSEIETSIKLEHPILQIKFNKGNGIRTISPLGKWKGMYFSEEIYNAQKYGYKCIIKSGYLFDKYDVFSDFLATRQRVIKN